MALIFAENLCESFKKAKIMTGLFIAFVITVALVNMMSAYAKNI